MSCTWAHKPQGLTWFKSEVSPQLGGLGEWPLEVGCPLAALDAGPTHLRCPRSHHNTLPHHGECLEPGSQGDALGRLGRALNQPCCPHPWRSRDMVGESRPGVLRAWGSGDLQAAPPAQPGPPFLPWSAGASPRSRLLSLCPCCWPGPLCRQGSVASWTGGCGNCRPHLAQDPSEGQRRSGSWLARALPGYSHMWP